MSSRKSSSASKSSSSSKSMKMPDADMKMQMQMQISSSRGGMAIIIITTVIIVLYNLLILGYIYNLEDKMCNCIRDWRHDFIKYFSMAMIAYSVLLLVLTGTAMRHGMVMKALCCSIMVLSFVNIMCLFTYIGDLDSSRCKCAIEDQTKMHSFLNIWRYVLVFFLVVKLIAIVVSAMM